MDGLSSEDEQQQPFEDEQQPDVESAVDPGVVEAGAGIGERAEAKEVP
jgi:hypothetical protein